jgi:hypothetical protein
MKEKTVSGRKYMRDTMAPRKQSKNTYIKINKLKMGVKP